MLHIVVFVLLFLVLLQWYKDIEPMAEKVIPVSFPRTDVVKLPSQVKPDGPTLDIQGPVLLGIAGGGADLTYVEANQSQILFNSSGYDQSSDAALYAENGLSIKAGSVKLPQVETGNLDATTASIDMLRVYRSEQDPYPNGWTPGIHTRDLYANGTIGAGQDGNLTVTMKPNGEIRATEMYSTIQGNILMINNESENFLDKVNAVKGRINDLNNQVRTRNANRAARERARREAEAAARNRRRGCVIL
jgi:hypothetical protein